MEELLKMPSQYVDQVMYSVKRQQRHRVIISWNHKKAKRPVSIEQQSSSPSTTTTATTSSFSYEHQQHIVQHQLQMIHKINKHLF